MSSPAPAVLRALLAEYRADALAWRASDARERIRHAESCERYAGAMRRALEVGAERALGSAKWIRHNGRCRVRGCGYRTSALLPVLSYPVREPLRRCPEHGRAVLWRAVAGKYAPEIKCDGRCESATGPKCDCQCGGVNHGAAHDPAPREERPAMPAPLPAQLDIHGGAREITPETVQERLFTPAPRVPPGQLGGLAD